MIPAGLTLGGFFCRFDKNTPMKKKLEEYQSEDIDIDVSLLQENKGQHKGLPANPRFIRNSEFKRLKESIKNNPWGLSVNRIIVNENNIVLAGNQRLKAIKDLGINPVPVQRIVDMPVDEQAKLILMHNDNAGDWDFDILMDKEVGFKEIDVEQFLRPSLIEKDEKLDQKQLDEKYTNGNARYPLIPVYDEKYNAVVIICETKTEFAQLKTIFELHGKRQSYKNTFLGETQVVNFKDLPLEKNNSKPQTA